MPPRLDTAPRRPSSAGDRPSPLPGGTGSPAVRRDGVRASTPGCPPRPVDRGTPRARLLEVLRGRASR